MRASRGSVRLILVLCAVCILPCTVGKADDSTRYLNRYSKAKAGINAVEKRIQASLHAEINEENARFQHEAKGSIPHNHHVSGGSKAQRNHHSSLSKTAAAEPIKSKAKSSREEHLARIRRKHAAAKVDASGKPDVKRAAMKGGAGHAHGHGPPPPPAFDIRTVNRFDPGQSLSFARELFETFALSYADTSLLTGYVGRDIVQLGHYFAMTRFGCALDCNDPSFNGVDGILGMGMPDASITTVPTPLLFALSNDRGGLEGANYINERPMHQRKFAFLSTAMSGEMQLGGYDRASTNADMVYVPTTSTTEYSVNVQSLTFGGIELLSWKDQAHPNAIPAILDTGTTCLVIPDSDLEGRVADKPFSKFESIMTKGMSFYITIDGHLFEIPFEFWWQKVNNAPCVQPSPQGYDGILLGDVVFQSLVVEFDLTKPHKPLIGIAPRNPLYAPVEPGQGDALKIPMIKRSAQGVYVEEPNRGKYRHGVDHVPVTMNRMHTQYFVNVSVGSPRQRFTVLVDTGSSTFAIFARMPPKHGNLHMPSPHHQGDRGGAPRGRRGRTGEYLEYPQRVEAQNNAANGGDAHSIASRGHTQSTLEVEGVSFVEGVRERAGVGSWFGSVTMVSGAAAAVAGLAVVRWRQRGRR